MSFESQARAYKDFATNYALPVIYVASGNLSSTILFADLVAPITVVTKISLLSGADLELLNSLSWDQQAEADHLVLLKASKFLGMSQSGFSWAVAVARRTESEDGTCGWRGTIVGYDMGKRLAMKDELSIIVDKTIEGRATKNKPEGFNLQSGLMIRS